MRIFPAIFFICLLSIVFAGTTPAQWVQMNGPYGGHVSCFAVSPANSGTGGTHLFAGTYRGGVFLSTDNGTRWTAVNNGLTSMYVSALAVSGQNLFAGTDDKRIFIFTDNGISGTTVDTSLTDTNVYAFNGNF